MRRILIDNARRKLAQRHGSGQRPLDVRDLEIAAPVRDDELLLMDDALEKLAALDRKKAALVKLRFFVGLTLEEAAEIMGFSVPTAKRYWTFARAWLYQEIQASRNKQDGTPFERPLIGLSAGPQTSFRPLILFVCKFRRMEC